MRVLKAIRLSRLTDETTSPERQDAAIMAKIKDRGDILAGEARDLDVSASKLSPFERPDLGKWLTPERADEYDAIMWWRLDRAVRSMNDLSALIEWARENKKRLIFVTGPGSEMDLDLTKAKLSPVTQMIMTVVAFAAQLESDAISERVADAQRHLRRQGLWGGGAIPYGLRPAGKKGAWKLVHDPVTYPILRELVERVLAGESQVSICQDFNKRALPTAKDHQDRLRGREPRGRSWSHSSTRKMLISKVLLGETTFEGDVVRDESGASILRTEPMVSEDEWGRLQAALAGRSRTRSRTQTPSMLLNVAFCGACGLPLYRAEYKAQGGARYYPYYVCRGRNRSMGGDCTQQTNRADKVDALVASFVLTGIGDDEIFESRYVPGEDHTEELSNVQRRIAELEQEWYSTEDLADEEDRQRYLSLKRDLMVRRNALAALPSRQAAYVDVGTGVTYRKIWPTLDNAAKRKLLLDLGVRVYVGRGEGLPATAKAWEEYGDSGSTLPGGGEWVSGTLSEDAARQLLIELGEEPGRSEFRLTLLRVPPAAIR